MFQKHGDREKALVTIRVQIMKSMEDWENVGEDFSNDRE